MKCVPRIAIVILAMLWPTILNAGAETGLKLFVAPNGSDLWSGLKSEPSADKSDGPFATLERARDEIRAIKKKGGLQDGGVAVFIRPGIYFSKQTFLLTEEDSGTENAPITYCSVPHGQARFIGGIEIKGFKPVDDGNILGRLEESARSHVLQVDLKSNGVTEYGELTPRGFGRAEQPAGLELFWGADVHDSLVLPMELARWPNNEWAQIAAVPDGSDGGKFLYSGDRPNRWKDETDVWLHGYWTWDWAESYVKVHSIDFDRHEFATEPPHGIYGYKKDGRYYALNALAELDQPGEWYLERKTGMLYFWPPDFEGMAPSHPLEGRRVYVSVLKSFVSMENVSHVNIKGIHFEIVRGDVFTIKRGAHNSISHCSFENAGNNAVVIDGGTDNGIESCKLFDCGDGGVKLMGGDRKTLTPAGNYVENSTIHSFSRWVRTYQPGVYISGVGNRISHNNIFDTPHCAIQLNGNDHLVEYNDIHDVCLETSDAGAFYLGRDWTERGNVVRYNYFHELGKGDVQAIYLDDWASGVTVVGNICYKAGRGVLLGGGRDNLIENNVFIDCKVGVHVDARGLGWAKNYFDGRENTLFDRFKAVNADKPPYSERYPQLVTLLNDEPVIPKNNTITRNIFSGGRTIDLLDGMTDKVIKIENNWTEGDPGFVDAAEKKFQLKDDAPALKTGFKRIDLEKIGPQKAK